MRFLLFRQVFFHRGFIKFLGLTLPSGNGVLVAQKHSHGPE